jgi:hypothetical protein
MQRLDRLPSLDFANERRGDIFTLEFPNEWDARQARRAAEVDPSRQEWASVGRRALAKGLVVVSLGAAAAARRLDDDAVEGRRVSGTAAR